MPVVEILSGAAARGKRTTLLSLSLLALIWRLSDLVEEATAGTPKMSMGIWIITDGAAVVVQIVIVCVLACIVFIAYSHMRQESTPESKDPQTRALATERTQTAFGSPTLEILHSAT